MKNKSTNFMLVFCVFLQTKVLFWGTWFNVFKHIGNKHTKNNNITYTVRNVLFFSQLAKRLYTTLWRGMRIKCLNRFMQGTQNEDNVWIHHLSSHALDIYYTWFVIYIHFSSKLYFRKLFWIQINFDKRIAHGWLVFLIIGTEN